MENKSHAIAAGFFVLVVGAMLAALAAWLTRDAGLRNTYEVSTREAVSGLQAQAPVQLRGVKVGKVESINFDPAVPGNVLLRLELDSDAPVTRATYAVLGYQGVTGLAFVQLDDDGVAAPALPPNDAQPPRIPLKPGLLGRLATQGPALLEKMDQIALRLNKLLGDDNQRRVADVLDNIGQAAGGVARLSSKMDATLATRLDPALAVVPALAEEGTKTMRALQGTATEINRTASDVSRAADEVGRTAIELTSTARRLNEKDGPLDRLAEGSEALSHAAASFNSATLPRVNRVTEDSSRAVRQLGRAASGINDNPQSLIFGTGSVQPGPGEPGFVVPGVGK